MIKVRSDISSQIHHLFVNNKNILVSLNEDLDSFAKVYFNLIDSILKVNKNSLSFENRECLISILYQCILLQIY